ncbi:MAG: hypothetical protein ACOVRP_00020, partial [Gemmatimonas sp.]
HPPEVHCGHPDQAFVLEPEQDLRLPRASGSNPLRSPLMQKRRLPSASHADHGQRFAGNPRHPNTTPSQVRWRRGQRFGELDP